MQAFSQGILRHKWLVLILFLAAAAVSAVLARQVKVNYQLMDYLPEDSPSTIALDVMNEAFDKPVPNLRVMVRDVSIPEALEYKKEIGAVEGVTEITWLDDEVSLEEPTETMDQETLHSWYKDGNALFSVTVDSDLVDTAVPEIRNIVGDQGAVAGDAASLSQTRQTLGSEMKLIMLMVIPLTLIILFISTSSWFEPLLFMVSVGVAILLNNGTNLIFGQVSFITMTTASVLQLAVSMDYSIFLLHRFAEFRREGMDVKEAMARAMEKSFSSILASALTTVIGFAALLFMRFKLGPDMGIVLAKGIVFSLLSVLFFLPVITVFTYKIIDITHHRSFLPSFAGFGKAVTKVFIPAVVVVAIVIVPAYLAQQNNHFIFGSSAMSSDETSQVYRDEEAIDALFGKFNQMVLLVPAGDAAKEAILTDELDEIPSVTSVVSYSNSVGTVIPQEFVPADSLEYLVSGGYSRVIVTVGASQESNEAFTAVEQIRKTAEDVYGDGYYLAGGSANVYDMRDTVIADNKVVAIFGIIGIGLVVLLTFRSISIPIILLLTIETSIWINLSIPYFLGNSMAYLGFIIISSVQLGATVDYAILMTNRYIENRRSHAKKAAISQTVANTTASILTSAGILASAGFILGEISSNGMVGEFGILIGRGAALSAAMVLLFLPAMLYFCDGIIQKTTLGLKFYKPERKG